MGYENLLQFIKEGESVSGGVAGRPDRSLDNNVRFLKELIDAAAIGSTIFAREVTVEAEVLQGTPVFLNGKTSRFERGLALVETDLATGTLLTAPSAQIWGVVYKKHNATKADLLLFGYAALDISAAVGMAVTEGTYYLSGTTPGRLVKQRPPVSVAVLRTDGLGKVFVHPQFIDFLDRHIHYKFPLTTRPAGSHTPPSYGDRHVIVDPDETKPGWLPANHPTFQGLAPAKAAFGYNFKAHPTLANVWPPIPVSQSYIEWNKALDTDEGFFGVPLGTSGLVAVDRYGIWWMSDCYGDVPWPRDLDTQVSVSVSISQDGGPECPRSLDMEMNLYFTKINFATDTTVVTSLRSADKRIIVRCLQDKSIRASGDLEIALDLNLLVGTNTARGHTVFKTLKDNTFERGPVAEGLYAKSSNVKLSSTVSTVPLDPSNPASATVHQGMIGIEVLTAPTRQLDVQLTRLNGASEEFHLDHMYLGLINGEESSFRSRIDIPFDAQFASPQLALRFRILGRAAGALPSLVVTGRRVPRPQFGLAVALPLLPTSSEFTITINTQATIDKANDYIEAESSPFAVAAGDLIFFTVKRLATDAYPAEVGILQQVGLLTGG